MTTDVKIEVLLADLKTADNGYHWQTNGRVGVHSYSFEIDSAIVAAVKRADNLLEEVNEKREIIWDQEQQINVLKYELEAAHQECDRLRRERNANIDLAKQGTYLPIALAMLRSLPDPMTLMQGLLVKAVQNGTLDPCVNKLTTITAVTRIFDSNLSEAKNLVDGLEQFKPKPAPETPCVKDEDGWVVAE